MSACLVLRRRTAGRQRYAAADRPTPGATSPPTQQRRRRRATRLRAGPVVGVHAGMRRRRPSEPTSAVRGAGYTRLPVSGRRAVLFTSRTDETK